MTTDQDYWVKTYDGVKPSTSSELAKYTPFNKKGDSEWHAVSGYDRMLRLWWTREDD